MAKYISRFKNLKIVVKPTLTQITNFGKKRVPGEAIQFENGVYSTEDKKEIKIIEGHRYFARKDIVRVKTKEEQEKEILKKAEKIKAKKK